MKEFLKYSKSSIIIALLIIIASYLIFLMNIGIENPGGIENDNWLLFWGGILSFLGTFFLGLVAMWQNEKVYSQNEKTLKQNDAQIKLALQDKIPLLMVKSCEVESVRLSEKYIDGFPSNFIMSTIKLQDGIKQEIHTIKFDATKENCGDILYKIQCKLDIKNCSESKIGKIKIVDFLIDVSDVFYEDGHLSRITGKSRTAHCACGFEEILLPDDSLDVIFELYYNDEFLFNQKSECTELSFILDIETISKYSVKQRINLICRNNLIFRQLNNYVEN